MKRLAVLFCIFAVFYLVKYEGYSWDPCSMGPGGSGVCLAIHCTGPSGMCVTQAEVSVCTDIGCATDILNKKGTQHLEGIYEVTFSDSVSNVTVKKMKVKPSYDLVIE